MDIGLARMITVIVSGVIFLGLIIWDIFLATDRFAGNTISEAIQHYAQQSMLLPATLGVLIGHWLWPSAWTPAIWIKIVGLSVIGAAFLGMDIYTFVAKENVHSIFAVIQRYPIVVFTCSVFLGRFFWPQVGV